ncbi:MAG: DNA-processing protein DprA [Ancrocorticia sp.]
MGEGSVLEDERLAAEDENFSAEEERLAAMAWTRLAEGEDVFATALVDSYGYARALQWLRKARAGAPVDERLRPSVARWCGRLDSEVFERDVERSAKLGGFLMPGDPLWPQSLMDLGEVRPLGLWYHGNPEILRGLSLAIVGSRDATEYGLRIATDFAYEFAEQGVVIVSGGAFGIDAAAHRGALAAGGKTVVVLAGGVDRPYPRQNASLFGEVLAAGGVIVSESPPGAQSLRHRFLARNRIIAGLSIATVVAEAPVRSGAISTARHALGIGRQVGAVPGPITSPRSAGCHMLMRSDAICVTSVQEVRELMGFVTEGESHPVPRVNEQLMLDIGGGAGAGDVAGVGSAVEAAAAHSQVSASSPAVRLTAASATVASSTVANVDDPLAGHPLAVRVRDALPVRRACSVARIATTAGVSVPEAIKGLGMLEMRGVAEQVNDGWRLSPAARG